MTMPSARNDVSAKWVIEQTLTGIKCFDGYNWMPLKTISNECLNEVTTEDVKQLLNAHKQSLEQLSH